MGDEAYVRTKLPKSGTLIPKPPLYSSPLYVERSIIRCKGLRVPKRFGMS
jgi:hypothetical protein